MLRNKEDYEKEVHLESREYFSKIGQQPDDMSKKYMAPDIQAAFKAGVEAGRSYDLLEYSIKRIPMTWCPALLTAFVKTCIRLGAFKEKQINVFVKGIEDKHGR